MIYIEQPPMLAGTPPQQLKQMRDYLVRAIEQINSQLVELENGEKSRLDTEKKTNLTVGKLLIDKTVEVLGESGKYKTGKTRVINTDIAKMTFTNGILTAYEVKG
jgi:hypothetical protein